MEFLKKHLISLLCGIAGLAFIGLTLFGMTRTTVAEKMEEQKRQAMRIKEFEANPINEAKIAAEKRRGELFKKEFDAAIEVAREINKREPIMAEVFPEPKSDAARSDFVTAYRQALGKLPVTLIAGGLPTKAEVDEEAENVRQLREMEQETGQTGKTDKPAEAPGPVARAMDPRRGSPRMPMSEGGRMMREGAMIGEGAVMGEFGGGSRGFAGDSGGGYGGPLNFDMQGNPAELKYKPEFRALVSKAKSIRCYADVMTGSFHVSRILAQTTPSSADMWKAQVSLWVQQDLVDAIAELNNEVGQQIQGEVCVEHMPVKRIERVNVYGYKLKDKWVYFEAYQESGSQPEIPSSFTGRSSDEQFDVVRFSTVVWLDQREIPKVIDRICKKNFYKCIEMDYRKPTEQELMSGYMYGTGPVVRARLEFEGYFSRPQYLALMPKEIQKELGAIQGDQGGGG